MELHARHWFPYGANVGVTRCQENGASFWRGSIVSLRYSNGKWSEPPWTTIRVRFGTGVVTPWRGSPFASGLLTVKSC
jgi:hypothetical protein